MSFILALLNGLVAIPKIASYVESAVSTIVQWYVNRQTKETLANIADAAAFAAIAETQEDRYAASERWRVALSRPRVRNV